MWPFSNQRYLSLIDAKRAERTRLLSSASTITTSDSDAKSHAFLVATAPQIVSKIKAGEWTASEVVDAYIKRAVLAQELTNCITEVLFERAREQAKELDDDFAATKTLRGPLHGVPVSVKDQYNVIGVDTTIGFTQWANNPAKTNATLVSQLINAGAIPLIKTNVPQTMFAFECNNPLWGRTTNPYSDAYTCGGSSGGEGAVLAMDGSALGLGSDIGGSLRIPASYCGIYSLKPGVGRVSNVGTQGPVPGFEGIKAVLGPMSRSIDDLQLFCRTIFGVQDSIDHRVAPIPFREVDLPKKMRFGYYTSNGLVKASPAVKRAVLETVDALKKEGHECILIEPPSVVEMMSIFVGISSSDGYRTMLSHLGPDPLDHSVWLIAYGARLPGFVRAVASWIIRSVLGDKMFATMLEATRVKPMKEYLTFVKRRDNFEKLFYADIWNKYELDGIIAPTQALPQLPHGGCTRLSSLASETIYYNVVDSPVGCMPVTRVDAAKDQLTEEWTKGPYLGAVTMEKTIYQGGKEFYDPEAMHGMPVGVQIVGKRWEEEKVLAMMRVVDEALGVDRGFGPGAWDKFRQVTA